jgi:hypothetical protein
MNKLKSFVKSIYGLIIKLVLLTSKLIFFFVPVYIIFLIGVQFYSLSLDKKLSNDQYNIILAAIGVTATLSGLSFRAGASSTDTNKKNIYYHQGKRLLHASLLFILAMPLSYIYNEFGLINEIAVVSLINKKLKYDFSGLMNSTCFVFAHAFFNIGLLLTLIGVRYLNEVLWKEKLLD